jgi:SAM-dependent methyltransferase
MGPDTLSRRELLRLKPNARDVDYAGWTQRLRGEFAGVDRAPLRRALAPVAAILAEQLGAGDRVLDAAGLVAPAGAVHCDLLDLDDLPHPDDSFDAVVSAFGFAQAPRALQTAQELVRVCRPGGTIALAAWTPRGLPGGLEEHVARPHGIVFPALWGQEERARRRLEPLLHGVTVRLRTVRIEFPTANAMCEQLVPAGQRLREPFDALLARNSASRGSAATAARYLLITGTVA